MKPRFTITFWDSEATETLRDVVDWDIKEDAQRKAKDLRRIFSSVKVVPLEKAKGLRTFCDVTKELHPATP